jgi:hypothetical protein
MPFASTTDHFKARSFRVLKEWQLFQSHNADPVETLQATIDSDYDRYRRAQQFHPSTLEKMSALQSEYDSLVSAMQLKNSDAHEAFELYQPVPEDIQLRDNRSPASGIRLVPLMYHSGNIIHPDPSTSRPQTTDLDNVPTGPKLPGDIDYGPPIDSSLYDLICQRYPQYLHYVNKYCRPAGTTNATFQDFNREQIPSAPIPSIVKERILSYVFRFLDSTPYLPIHFVDTQYAKTPLVTGTGYHNRHSYKIKAHAKYTAPDEYKHRPTSKGYFYNSTYENARTLIHYIKKFGLPFNIIQTDENRDLTDPELITYVNTCNKFFNDYPTLLFTRNHISSRDSQLKVRPVYAVDDIFIIIELMLTFPLVVQARKPSCCIMYGLETIRGSNHFIDALACSYNTYFTVDWTRYDQTLPRVITDIFYTDYLRRLIVISHGYHPTYDYPTYPDLDEHKLYSRMSNLLHFLHLWYNNMTYVTADGYAYRRTTCGIPSGLYNTQYLGSFGNLFLMIHAMIQFRFSDSEINEIIIFILGDDNTCFLTMDISRVHKFIKFLEEFALYRYNMVLSYSKSILTTLRSKIETLGYQCNFGQPKRDIGKLVAQLCYPERSLRPHTMSVRAIGIAYASAGYDPTFHSFCQDVYNLFRLEYRPDPSTTNWLIQHVFQNLESGLPELETPMVPPFPSMYDIQLCYSQYKGPLSFAPKWNYAHFINDPDKIPTQSKTMHQYEIENSILIEAAPTFDLVMPTNLSI